MAIQVTVKFLGIFQRLTGQKIFQIPLQEPATVKQVIEKLSETFSQEFKQTLLDSQLNDPRPNALILVAGKEISVCQGLETPVTGGDEIVLVPMVHGG
ncbi:MAG: MoaD/ThiS family protein [Candidatus Bathyarchaeia archaeon]|jgi:MoaD family protein